jgi:hypothetical protein
MELIFNIKHIIKMRTIYFNKTKAPLSLLRGCIAGLVMMSALSCVDDPFGQTPTDSNPPAPLTIVRVEPLPGGGKILYNLPKETDLSYVKGEFLFQGTKRVIRASIYNNYLTVEGLGSTDPIDITLYVVDHSENLSAPETVTFTPDTPPIETFFSSLQIRADFGGVNVAWENPLGLEIGITLSMIDSVGELKEISTVFRNEKKGNYSFRGLDTIQRTFVVSAIDRWGNTSDAVEAILTPLFEKQLDRLKHQQVILPLDNTTTFSGSTQFGQMFNGTTVNRNDFWHTQEGNPDILMPIVFTLDLGVDATLSRFILWHRTTNNWEFTLHNVKDFEVWASKEYRANMPETYWDQTWKSEWNYVGMFRCSKPSGDDVAEITADDRTIAQRGFEFNVPIETGIVRYMRFAVHSTWGNTNAVSITELQFFGGEE